MANKNKDIFAPPSEQELKEFDSDPMFAPPTAEELSPPLQPASSSTLGDFGTGVHRGMMLGGAEELSGLGSAIGEKVADTDTFQKLADWYYAQKTGASPEALQIANEAELAPKKSFYEAYRKGQQQEQAVSDAARKASPWAYGTGQVAGGLVPGIASAPLAAAAPVATAFGTGAVMGGLESSANIEDPLAMAQDMAFGGVTGLALQKILPGGPKKPAKDVLKRGEFLPQLETAKQLGEEGISLSAKPEARAALTERLQSGERELAQKFIGPRKQLGEAVGESLSDVSGHGNVLTQSLDNIDAIKNVEEVLISNVKGIGRGKTEQLVQKARDLQQGLLSPQEAYQFRKELAEVTTKIADPQHQQILRTGLDNIKETLDQSIPGFGKASKEFAQFAEAGPEALLSKGHDPEIADVFLGNLSKGDLKISEKVRDLLGSIRSGGQEGLKKQGEFFGAMRELEKLAQSNPELVKRLGIDPAKLTKELISKADEVAVAQKVAGQGITAETLKRGSGIRGILASGETASLRAANVYGQAKKTVRDFANSSIDQLVSAANALKQHGGPDLQAIAEGLSSAIPQKRNAAIFSLLQLPKAKHILGIGDEE
jgi:hypothetical protein